MRARRECPAFVGVSLPDRYRFGGGKRLIRNLDMLGLSISRGAGQAPQKLRGKLKRECIKANLVNAASSSSATPLQHQGDSPRVSANPSSPTLKADPCFAIPATIPERRSKTESAKPLIRQPRSSIGKGSHSQPETPRRSPVRLEENELEGVHVDARVGTRKEHVGAGVRAEGILADGSQLHPDIAL